MKRSFKSFVLTGAVAILLSGISTTHAQRGDFNIEEIRQRQMDNYREQLAVTNDDEWKVLLPRITKVSEARQALQQFSGGGRGGFGGGRGGRGGRGGDADANAGGGRRGGGIAGFGTPNPVVTALREAVEANASVEDLKAKVEAWRKERKAKEADLAKAHEELKTLLSSKQEAIAITLGLMQ